MKQVPLTQGLFASVDDSDFESVSKFKWHALKIGPQIYAGKKIKREDGSRVEQYLHRFLFPDSVEVDHKNGDGLNNQRYNLRPCLHVQNMQGFRPKTSNASSKYRGVCKPANSKTWMSYITVLKRRIYLGRFNSEALAARAYDTAASKFFGEFATLNFKPL